ncbi:MAG: hypothetical protein IJZ74_02755, partial [Clostridia bacterium]|nr:hypothetical protein [Clostridia bacterium]
MNDEMKNAAGKSLKRHKKSDSSRKVREKGLQKEHRGLLIEVAETTKRKSNYAPRTGYRNTDQMST